MRSPFVAARVVTCARVTAGQWSTQQSVDGVAVKDDDAAPSDRSCEGSASTQGPAEQQGAARIARRPATRFELSPSRDRVAARGRRGHRTGDRGVAALSTELAATRRVCRDLGRRLHGAAGDGLHGARRRAAGGRAVDCAGGADRVRRAGFVAGVVGRSRVDDRPDGRHGDRTAGGRRSRPGGGVGRRAEPDRGRVVPGRPTGPPRRDLRPALPAAPGRLSRRCGRADGRRAAGQDDRDDRRG